MFSTLGLSQPRINLQGIFGSNSYKELNFWFGFSYTPMKRGNHKRWVRTRENLNWNKKLYKFIQSDKSKDISMTFPNHQNEYSFLFNFETFVEYLSTGKYLNISTFGSHLSKPVFLQIRNCCLLLSSTKMLLNGLLIRG